jgi:hypothetical protein
VRSTLIFMAWFLGFPTARLAGSGALA